MSSRLGLNRSGLLRASWRHERARCACASWCCCVTQPAQARAVPRPCGHRPSRTRRRGTRARRATTTPAPSRRTDIRKPNFLRMTGTPLSVVASVTRAKLWAVTTCTTSCAHRSPSPQLDFCSNPCDVPSPPPQVRVRARFPAAATAAATAAAHGGARRRRLRSVWVFFARARTTAAAATEVPRASFRGTLSSPPSPHDATFLTRRVFMPYTTSRDVTRGRYGDRTAIRS